MSKNKVWLLLFALPLIFANSVAFAGHAELAFASGSNYSENDFSVCQTAIRNVRVKYTHCPPGIWVSNGCAPYGTCGANPYRMEARVYRNNNQIWSKSFQGSASWSNFYFYNQNLTPGTYRAEVTLKKRNWTCIGWNTVETVHTNSVVVNGTSVVPDFDINGITVPSDGSPIDVPASYIRMNAASTSCESQYFITVQESDRWWNRTYDYEWDRWFGGQAPNNINLQLYSVLFSVPPYFTGTAIREASPLIGGILANGDDRYFRVSLCTNEPSWNCKGALIRVDCCETGESIEPLPLEDDAWTDDAALEPLDDESLPYPDEEDLLQKFDRSDFSGNLLDEHPKHFDSPRRSVTTIGPGGVDAVVAGRR